MQISQSGFDLLNSCPDIWSALCIQVLADKGSVEYDPESAASVISTALGADINQAREMVRNLTVKGYLDEGGVQPQIGQNEQPPGVQGGVPSPTTNRSIGMTQEGVPSVLPTRSQTSQAEASGAIPSVLPGKPRHTSTPIEEGEKKGQAGLQSKFQQMLKPRGIKA